MASRTANFTIDAHDPRAQVAWWAQVLDDFEPDGEDTDDEAELRGPAGRWLIFIRVPDRKTVKNRMHICLRPVDRSRDDEIERLLGLGATVVNDLRAGDEGWAVLADPEGNEFCVLSTRADEAESHGLRRTWASGCRGRDGCPQPAAPACVRRAAPAPVSWGRAAVRPVRSSRSAWIGPSTTAPWPTDQSASVAPSRRLRNRVRALKARDSGQGRFHTRVAAVAAASTGIARGRPSGTVMS